MLGKMFITVFFFATVQACLSENNETDESQDQKLSYEVPNYLLSNFCGEAILNEEPMAHARKNDVNELSDLLSTDGIKGYMHGVVPQFGYYVLNYGPTLDSEQFSLIPNNELIKIKLDTLNRHDLVNVKGRVMENSSPVVHIIVEDIDLIEKYPLEVSKIEYDSKNYDEFLENDKPNDIFGKVHTVSHDGRMLVLDYQNLIIPIMIHSSHEFFVKDLYRNDKIIINVTKLNKSRGPLHLMTNPEVNNPITIIDRMVNCHGKNQILSGTLVLFKKSPQITRDVFAIKILDPNGIERNFTFFPDIDPSIDPEGFIEMFSQISSKLKLSWDENKDGIVDGRNSLNNRRLQIRAKGVMNVVSQNQANPQIYISNINDISIEVEDI